MAISVLLGLAARAANEVDVAKSAMAIRTANLSVACLCWIAPDRKRSGALELDHAFCEEAQFASDGISRGSVWANKLLKHGHDAAKRTTSLIEAAVDSRIASLVARVHFAQQSLDLTKLIAVPFVTFLSTLGDLPHPREAGCEETREHADHGHEHLGLDHERPIS